MSITRLVHGAVEILCTQFKLHIVFVDYTKSWVFNRGSRTPRGVLRVTRGEGAGLVILVISPSTGKAHSN